MAQKRLFSDGHDLILEKIITYILSMKRGTKVNDFEENVKNKCYARKFWLQFEISKITILAL